MTRRKTKPEVTEDVPIDTTSDAPLTTKASTIEEKMFDEDEPVKPSKVELPKVELSKAKPINHDKLLPRSASKYTPPLRPIR